MLIDTTGLDPAAVLAGLYNASIPLGMGILHFRDAVMTPADAATLLASGPPRFDYLRGRVLKVDLDDPCQFEARLYDRDNGDGAAQRVIDALRASTLEGEGC